MKQARTQARGAALVVALLIAIILLLMGYGMLVMQSRAYGEARLQRDSLQALLLARAGLDSVLIRLSKDPTFPPWLGGRKTFSLIEAVPDPDTGEAVGRYQVTVDVSRRGAPPEADLSSAASYNYPNFTVRIRSEGIITDSASRVVASRRIEAELDLSPKVRGQAPASSPRYTNPGYFRFLRWEDSASP